MSNLATRSSSKYHQLKWLYPYIKYTVLYNVLYSINLLSEFKSEHTQLLNSAGAGVKHLSLFALFERLSITDKDQALRQLPVYVNEKWAVSSTAKEETKANRQRGVWRGRVAWRCSEASVLRKHRTRRTDPSWTVRAAPQQSSHSVGLPVQIMKNNSLLISNHMS